jgi:hypothetical protein
MAYNSIINGGPQTYATPAAETAQALIPLEYANDIIDLLPAQSTARKKFQQVNMGHSTLQVPVLDVLPKAYWVGNQGITSPSTPGAENYGALEQTTEMGWKGVQLVAQELAVDVPIPKVTLADSMFPIWEQVVPKVAAALALALDAATLFGYESPFTGVPALIPASIKAGNVETKGTHTTEEGGLAHDVSSLFNQVEAESGFYVTGAVASRSLLYAVRNARSTLGTQIPIASGYQIDEKEWYGTEVDYLAAPGLWPVSPKTGLKGTVAEKTSKVTLTTGETTSLRVGDQVTITGLTDGPYTITKIDSTTIFEVNFEFTKADQEATAGKVVVTAVNPVAIVGDFSQAILGTRQDISYEIFKEGVIMNNKGEITTNLMTQGAVNLRVTARFGYAVANSVTYYQPEESKRYPFSVLLA